MTDGFRRYPDLARRDVGGAVVSANDEAFAARQNLLTPGPAVFDPSTFGPDGKVYDGWETRRRREAGQDHVIVRLGTPGVVHGIDVDTAFALNNLRIFGYFLSLLLLGGSTIGIALSRKHG